MARADQVGDLVKISFTERKNGQSLFRERRV